MSATLVGDWNELPAVVVEQESPAAFKNQLDRLAPVACRNASPPPIGVILHEEVCQVFIKTRQDVYSLWNISIHILILHKMQNLYRHSSTYNLFHFRGLNCSTLRYWSPKVEQLSNRRVVGRPDDSGERFAWNRITACECAYYNTRLCLARSKQLLHKLTYFQ